MADDDFSTPTKRLLTLRHEVSVRQLAEQWGPEIGYDTPTAIAGLARAIVEDKLAWPGDAREEPTVLLYEPKSGRTGRKRRRELMAWATKEAALRRCDAVDVLWELLEDNRLFIAREEVCAFADKLGVPCPTWWPRPAANTNQAEPESADADLVTQLVSFWNAGPKMKDPQAKTAAENEFGPDLVTDSLFRAARRDPRLNPNKKYKRGES